MKVFITGAAGALGVPLGNALVEAGCEVVGCDLRPASGARFPIHLLDLAAGELGPDLLAGCEAVVHLANHSNHGVAAPERILGENAAMDREVFKRALDAGVRTLVLASSMQLFNGRVAPGALHDAAYLPMDGRMPYRIAPGNA